MEVFSVLPNWIDGINIRYSFDTTLFKADNEAEQRSGLRQYPAREETFKIFEASLDIVKIINKVLYTILSEIMVPIYSEWFVCTDEGNLRGLTGLYTPGIGKFFNSQFFAAASGTFVILDKTGVISPEIKTVSTMSDTEIAFNEAIIGNFTSATAILFPSFVGFLDSIPPASHLTDSLAEYEFDFKEKRAFNPEENYLS